MPPTLEQRIDKLEECFNETNSLIVKHIATTAESDKTLQELIDVVHSMGVGAKILTYIGTVAGSVWAIIKLWATLFVIKK